MQIAQKWISSKTSPTSLFSEQKQTVLNVDKCKCIAVSHIFSYDFFRACLVECGLSNLSELLLDLAVIRLI